MHHKCITSVSRVYPEYIPSVSPVYKGIRVRAVVKVRTTNQSVASSNPRAHVQSPSGGSLKKNPALAFFTNLIFLKKKPL